MTRLFIITALFCSVRGSAQTADTSLLRKHVTALVSTPGHRNYLHTASLDTVAAYIYRRLLGYADSVYFQEYTVNGRTYRNVVGIKRGVSGKRLIIGAHYDVCDEQSGADDNASGVAGLLETARLLKDRQLQCTVEYVAYTLEEPPFFRSDKMGSFVHASSLHRAGANVMGMISLEMIGYFTDARRSQHYPLGLLRLIYGSRGNYITLVNKYGAGSFARRFSRRYTRSHLIRTKKFAGPKFLPGVDFSDHLNYWKFGYSALMITDTSFYRNANYHETGDTISTLDFVRMAQVVNATAQALASF